MGKVPRGAAFIPTKQAAAAVKKRQQPADRTTRPCTSVVFFGGKRAVLLGAASQKRSEAEAEAAVDGGEKEQGACVGFVEGRYRHWKQGEIVETDGDIRRGLRDERKRRRKSRGVLAHASSQSAAGGEAGPLNRAISEYGAEKQLSLALKALKKLLTLATPTVYTLAGIVNACVRCGDISAAEKFIEESTSWGVTPNEVVLTTLMKGLCSDGRQKDATKLLCCMQENYGVHPNQRMASTLMRGCMRNADGKHALLTAAKLKEFGQEELVHADPNCVEYTIKALASAGYLKEAASYLIGKSSKPNEAACTALAASCVLLEEPELARAALATADVVGTRRSFGGGGGKREASAALFNTLRDNEVVAEKERIESVLVGATKLSKPLGRSFREDSLVLMLPDTHQSEAYAAKAKGCFADPSLPLRVEVCSGHGEWVVERAAAERGIANWVSVEIRPDRVHQAWARCRFLGKDDEPRGNLLLICADARQAVSALPAESVQDLFINFPEPPGWMDSKLNLLDDDFFHRVHGVLAVGGAVTMVSDHALYSACTALRLVKMAKAGNFYSSLPPGNGLPVSTAVPTDYGSSYFHRMWLNGKKTKRFFLHFVKPTRAIAMKLREKAEAEQAEGEEEGAGDDLLLHDPLDEEEEEDDEGGQRGDWEERPKRRRVVYL